jgi:xanthine/CO dehydrogenase XdhC/CoxF family maturation factor
MAHGALPPDLPPRTLIAVFTSPVADHLLHFGRDLGFRTVLLEPDSSRLADAEWRYADHVSTAPQPEFVDQTADVVLTDHDRPELGSVLHGILMLPARWVGVMGSPRHTAPHVAALRDLGVPDPTIARVHRPIGLNIGSRTPPEIAISTLAGLIADRNGRPGGFGFAPGSAGQAGSRSSR